MSGNLRDIGRTIKASLGRFLAVLGIVALGCGFFSGLKMAGPVMREAADRYYDQSNLSDFHLFSSEGFGDAEVKELSKLDGVSFVFASKSYDVLAHSPYAKDYISLRLCSFNKHNADRLTLIEGRMPEAKGEIVVSADAQDNLEVGDSLELTKIAHVTNMTDVLSSSSLRVVGKVRSSDFFATNKIGSTALGSGTLDDFAYTSETTFESDSPYTQIDIGLSAAYAAENGSAYYTELTAAFKDKLDELKPKLEELRKEELYSKIDTEIAKAQAELDAKKTDAAKNFTDKKIELESAKEVLNTKAKDLANAKNSLAAAEANFDVSKQSVLQEIAEGWEKLTSGEKELLESLDALGIDAKDLAFAKVQIRELRDKLDTALKQIITGKEELVTQISVVKQALAEANTPDEQQLYTEQVKALEAKLEELEQQQGELKLKKQAIVNILKNIDELEAAKQELSDQQSLAEGQLSAAEKEIEQSKRQIADGEVQLEEGIASWEKGRNDLAEAEARVDKEFADAQNKINKEQKSQKEEYSSIDIHVIGRDKFEAAAMFQADSERIDAIANVFPLLFFLVAALVSLTTMTRMVEDDRLEIGCRKALGYGSFAISKKYLLYAFFASGLGSVIGIAVLSQLIPYMVLSAYQSIYAIPLPPLPFVADFELAILSAAMGIGVCLVATYAAMASTLKEKPADLMLPRAPKAGKRILLEYITPLWKHLSFSWKVSVRNIFRYKRRLGMTVLGVAGCTALLLVGLGLGDALRDSVTIHFTELIKYSHIVTADDSQLSEAKNTAALKGTNALWLHMQAMYVSNGEDAKQNGLSSDMTAVSLIVPKDASKLEDFVTLRDRKSQQTLPFTKNSCIVSEKLADTYHLLVGDTIALFDQDSIGNATGSANYLEITGICENYIGNSIYVGNAVYKKASFAEDGLAENFYDEAYVLKLSTSEAENLSSSFAISAIQNVDAMQSEYEKIIAVSNSVVILLIVSAALLCAIVLYNLTNINVSERVREVATLKVLGFTKGELDMYIFREILLLSVIGDVLGLFLGSILERFVIQTAEVSYMMFGRTIHLASYLIAFGMTLLFTLIVLFLMRPRLRKIDMVTSLKSVE